MENKQYMAFADTETTGLNPKVNGIHQIALVITDSDLNEVERLDLKFTPHPDAVRDSGHFTLKSDEELDARVMTSFEAHAILIKTLQKYVNKYDKKDKLQFVAYNARFDEDFLRHFFEQHNSKEWYGSYFWTPCICVYLAMGFYAQTVRSSFPDMKLGTMCRCAEIPFQDNEAHDAMYDVEKTILLYKYLGRNMTSL